MHILLCVMDYEVAWQIMCVDLIMIWIMEWPALHFDIRTLVSEFYYSGLLCIYVSVYVGHLGTTADCMWTVDHWYIRITYNPLWMWIGYPDFHRFITTNVMDGLSRLRRVDRPKRGHLSPCELYIAPFSVFWIMLYILSCHYLYHCFIWSHLSLLNSLSYFDFEL